MTQYIRTRKVIVLLALTVAGARAAAASEPLALLYSLLNPSTNAQAGAVQGASVAMDGNFAVVGAPYDSVGGTYAGVAKIYNVSAGALLYTLTNPSPAASENFGTSVAISGAQVAIGTVAARRVWIYDLASATAALPILALTNANPNGPPRLDFAMTLSGAWLAVGYPNAKSGNIYPGNASVFNLAGATPTVPILVLTNPNPAHYPQFGYSIAVSGTRVVVGAPSDSSLVATNSGIAYVYDLDAAIPTVPVITLTNPSPVAGANFGWAVTISGLRIGVGAPGLGDSLPRRGRTYVFDLGSAKPTVPVLTLTDPGLGGTNRFGSAVALVSTRLVIGADGASYGTTNAGNAYVYDLAGTTPAVPALTLNNPTPAAQDSFGFAVAISGPRILIGAPGDDTRQVDAGSAYIYNLAGATPNVPTATLDSPSPAAGIFFGMSVACSGKRVVVGSPFDDTGALDAGVVYVYDLASATPTIPMLTLTNPTPTRYGGFGWSVAIFSNRVVIGQIYQDDGPTYAGTAYIYDLASPTPAVPIIKLTNPRPRESDHFGASLAISGSRVCVGVPNDSAEANSAGRAHVYDLASATPSIAMLTLTNPSPAGADNFGHDVAISGTRAVVGAFQDDTGANNTGIAYVYDLAIGSAPILTLTNPAPATDEWFGSAVAISGTRVVVGAYGDKAAGWYVGSAYVYNLSSPTPGIPELTLANPTPAPNDSFGYSVAIAGTRIAVGAVYDGNAGSTYVYDLDAATPAFPVATLSSPRREPGDYFGNALAIDDTTIAAAARGFDGTSSDRGSVYVFGLRPTLSIASSAPGLARLSWTPTNSSEFVLQYTGSLPSTNWINAPSGAANPIVVPATNASRFYRLFQP